MVKYKVVKTVSPNYLTNKVVTEFPKDKKTKKPIAKSKSKKFKKLEKIVKKPTAKLPSYSAKRIIQQMGKEQGVLVRQVENPYENPTQDNRSLFFKEEYKRQKERRFGGFI